MLGEEMLRPKNILILICSVVFLVVGIELYFNYQSQQEFLQLKESFKQDDKIAVLEHLLASEKYASDIRKAGYIIPPDGAIRLDGVIYPLEIEGDIHLKIGSPQKQDKDFQVFFITQVNGKQTYVAFVLDKNLNLLYTSYSQDNSEEIREGVSIPQSEEACLLKIVQNEIDGFMKKMYQTLYG